MKRQRSSSKPQVPTPTESSETKEEPPKKVRKLKPSISTPTPAPAPTSLGSLSLYGEQLPEKGVAGIPPAAQHTCAELKKVLENVREFKLENKAPAEAAAEEQRGLVLFASLKKLNRLSHLFCKDAREQTHEQKLEVDDLHLQLQNLMYEAMHLRREITNCLEFKSRHEDIDLISEEEFYATAPETISKPEVTKKEEHQRMLSRLEWELEQRKQLAAQQSSLEGEIEELEKVIGKMEGHLASLQPSLEEVRRATLPLQEALHLPLDRLREEQEMATLLPLPLYIVYMQARAYAEVQDPTLSVAIGGDVGEARASQRNTQAEQSDEESGDSDVEGGKEESSRRKKRHKRSRSSHEKKAVSKAYPLTINLTLTLTGVGTFTVTLSYLPYFSAVCASVTSLSLEDLPENQLASFLEKGALLHCLFEGDTGRTSPNSVVSLHIRKHGGDLFSAAVRQHGFPYKWVQRICGVDLQSENPDSADFQPRVDVSAESVEAVVSALVRRFTCQVYLTRQIVALDEHKLLQSPSASDIFPSTPQSQLVRWKHITLQEVQATQFASLAIFNLQERTNRFFLAAFQIKQVRLHSLVCVGTDYPSTPPSLAVMVESNGQRETHNIQTKHMEAEVNLYFPRSLKGDKNGQYLLCNQLRRLQECFDIYVEHRTLSEEHKPLTLHQTRGRGRLLSFSNC